MSFNSVAASRKRLIWTFGAQIYSQLVTVGSQLMLVPVLLYFWGTAHYGIWLLLSAVPAYLTFADLGFTVSAKNEMTIKFARNDRAGVLVTYQSTFILLSCVSIFILTFISIGLYFIDIEHIFSIDPVREGAAKSVILYLACNVLLSQYTFLIAASLRCIGRPAEEVCWSASARLGEGIATFGAASLGGDMVAAAIAIASSRLIFNFAAWWRLRYLAPWLRLGWVQAAYSEIRKLFHPSLSFMLISLGQALMIQGPVIILGLTGTPFWVVVFSTSRTLARLGTSAATMLNAAIIPEYSLLFGTRNMSRYMRLARFHLLATVCMTAAYLTVLSFGGGWILLSWTHKQINVEQPFFTILLFSVGTEMIWTALLMPLASINKHIKLAYSFCVLAILGLLLSYWAGLTGGGLAGVTMPLLAVHLLMIPFVSVQLWKLRNSFIFHGSGINLRL